ncbi:SDR family NAD(P)-dependent oxidoreductase [Nonomuraea sp. WAC 01424]|uniref:SDR family NAD(P)-dependent oxidoreductase n=1 Tax=Nonomuraea sp. WAC 01424 TaxID=2203200 RepID=UPI0021AD86F2|nr:SDR family NAD(P)-dependent oxidoreductase [Nonomuraea sp. WAC 01424]
MFAELEENVGPVDVVIANAGYGLEGTFEETPLAAVRQQVEVNVFGAMATPQAALPHLRRRRSMSRAAHTIDDHDTLFTPIREARQKASGNQPGNPAEAALRPATPAAAALAQVQRARVELPVLTSRLRTVSARTVGAPSATVRSSGPPPPGPARQARQVRTLRKPGSPPPVPASSRAERALEREPCHNGAFARPVQACLQIGLQVLGNGIEDQVVLEHVPPRQIVLIGREVVDLHL